MQNKIEHNSSPRGLPSQWLCRYNTYHQETTAEERITRKIISLLLNVVMVLSLFAGCGSDSGSEDTLVYGSGDDDSINPINRWMFSTKKYRWMENENYNGIHTMCYKAIVRKATELKLYNESDDGENVYEIDIQTPL